MSLRCIDTLKQTGKVNLIRINKRRLLSTALTIVAVMFLTACEDVHEPWVHDSEYLQQERNRSPVLEKALQNRAKNYQIDR